MAADATGSFEAAKEDHMKRCKVHILPPEPAPGSAYGPEHFAYEEALDRLLLLERPIAALLELPLPGHAEHDFGAPIMAYLPPADLDLLRKHFEATAARDAAEEKMLQLLSERLGLRDIIADCPPPPPKTDIMPFFAFTVMKSKASATKAHRSAHLRAMASPTASTAAKAIARQAAAAAEAEEDGGRGGGAHGSGCDDASSALSELLAMALAEEPAHQVAQSLSAAQGGAGSSQAAAARGASAAAASIGST